MMFFRSDTDKRQIDCTEALKNSNPGGVCWLIGAGPSLKNLCPDESESISNSAAARFACNNAGRREDGTWILKPTHWTTYDPTMRFGQAIFNDPSITKFASNSRIMDVIPGEEKKLCDCPNVYFIEKEARDYQRFFDPAAEKILDTRDSFIQALVVAFALGFRRFYVLGAEMCVPLSGTQQAWCVEQGVEFREDGFFKKADGNWSDRLSLLVDTVKLKKNNQIKAGAIHRALEECENSDHYCFGERKHFASAVSTDSHYWERVQYLRLAQRSRLLNGVEIISCMPSSRLNSILKRPPITVQQACAEIEELSGSIRESMPGCYTSRRRPSVGNDHRDIGLFRFPESMMKTLPAPEVIDADALAERKAQLKDLASKEIEVD